MPSSFLKYYSNSFRISSPLSFHILCFLSIRYRKFSSRKYIPILTQKCQRIVSHFVLPQFCPNSHIVKLTLHFHAHFGAGHKNIKPLICKHNVVYVLLTLALKKQIFLHIWYAQNHSVQKYLFYLLYGIFCFMLLQISESPD